MVAIDWEKVSEWLEAGADGTDVAAALGIHPETLYDRCKKEQKTDFSVYRAQKRAVGMNSLRVARYELATKDKNPTMMIWLSKQMLGETDKPGIVAETDRTYQVEIITANNADTIDGELSGDRKSLPIG
jgi:IS30 family transposase